PESFLTSGWGIGALLVLVFAYTLVLFEEKVHMRKSVPVLVSAGLIWLVVAYVGKETMSEAFAETAFKHALLEYGELFLFLMVAMTYVNTLQERNVFERLRFILLDKK